MNMPRHPIHRGAGRDPARRQTGVAIIAALVVVAAASIASATIIESQALLADTLAGERERVQAKWLLRGGLDWSRIILLNDARRNAVTHKGAIWSQAIVGLEVSTPGQSRKAYFSGQIEDEQGKFNIWSLAENGMIRPQELAVLESLLSGLNLPMSLAQSIARRVADTQAGPYAKQTAPGLRTLNDLRKIDELTPETAAILDTYLTILPEKTTINANTASAEVLSAIVPGLHLAEARDMVGQRERGQWFNSRADFFNRLGKPAIKSSKQIGVDSEWFKVTGQITLGESVASMQALLHRQGGQPPSIRWASN
ncbi:type II secretion system minor pseudopilin GspK [Pollutimonas harenae]|uniref:Type II secretion system protein K n=1 Tax=Pollutimonas harenae TaxID=657015 RepID=A0A853H2I2_9BURK|nr:type II secretion system minor pseudopilin GspK [Pollutimonas harenae]NYT86009.1 type II secretion system minor pseudopilin GspK [Pollutimonas harenae]TEA71057.1 general secretion pathway protein GspK [Pollutimonas harenae]